MGYRGPIPKPTAIEIAEGRPGKRPLNGREPQPRAVTPKCPAYLDKRAKEEWRRLVPILRRAQAKLNETGILYKAPSGYVMQSPLLPVVNAQVDTISRLSREFGLTPAARSRLTITDQDADIDVLERALCG